MRSPKFNWFQMKTLYVLTPLSLQKLAQVAEIDFMVLADTATIEKWDRKKVQYNSLSEVDKQNLTSIGLLLDPDKDNSSDQQFIKDVLKKVNDAKARTTKDVVKDKYANQLSEFGMTRKDAAKLLEEYDRAVSGAPDDNYEMDVQLSEREQLDIINAGYAMISRGLNSSLYQRIQGLERQIKNWENIMEDTYQKYLLWHPTATFEEAANKMRPLSYAAQSLAKLLGEWKQLTGVDKYVDVQSSLARLRSLGYHVVHDEQLREINK